VYNYTMNQGKITTEVMGPDNKVITSSVSTQNGNVNTPYNVVNEKIPVGYHITSITVNGVTTDVNNLSDLLINDGSQTVIYHIAKNEEQKATGTVKVEIENSNGTVIQSSTTNGIVGTPYKNLIPSGKVAYTTVNGVKNGSIPSTIVKGETTIIYHLEPTTTPIPKPTPVVKKGIVNIKIVNQNGEVIGTASHEGAVGSDFNPITIPNGDTINNITVNGNSVSNAPTTIENGTTNIVYHVTVPVKPQPVVKTGKVIIKVVNQDGTVIEQSNQNGKVGSTFNPITIPSGDTINNITVNGNSVSNAPTTIENGTTTIIYHITTPVKPQPVIKTGKVIIKVVNQDGTVIEQSNHEGAVGSNFNPITIPSGDTVNNITVNGNSVSSAPTTIENGTTTIIYHITTPAKPQPVIKTGKVIIKVVNQDGTVIEQSNHEGAVGSNFNPITIPSGDIVNNITVNGNSVSSAPTTIENGTTTIIYHITTPAKKVNKNTLQIIVRTEQGQVISDTNSLVKDGSVIQGITVPKGYHLVSTVASVNGNNVSTIPTTVEGNTKIIYTIEPNTQTQPQPQKPVTNDGSVTIKYVYNGKVIKESNYNSSVGTPFEIGSTPNGYKITSIDVNGQETTNVPTTIQDGKTSIIINLTKPEVNIPPKVENGEVSIKIVTENGKVLYDNNSNVKIGTNIQLPKIPAGYHLVKTVIAINGNGTNNMPTKVVEGKTIIVYTVAKNAVPTIPIVKPDSNNNNNLTNGNGVKQTSNSTQKENNGVKNNSSSNVNSLNNSSSTNSLNNDNSTVNMQPISSSSSSSEPQTPQNINNNQSTTITTQSQSKITSLPDTGLSSLANKNTKSDVAGAAGLLGVLLGLLEIIRRKKK
ncbi:MAG: hypothetical protein ACRCYE_13755, partial [Sarcina sp.]